MKLTATINAAGKTAAGIVVPDEFVDALGGGGRPKVRVTVGATPIGAASRAWAACTCWG